MDDIEYSVKDIMKEYGKKYERPPDWPAFFQDLLSLPERWTHAWMTGRTATTAMKKKPSITSPERTSRGVCDTGKMAAGKGVDKGAGAYSEKGSERKTPGGHSAEPGKVIDKERRHNRHDTKDEEIIRTVPVYLLVKLP